MQRTAARPLRASEKRSLVWVLGDEVRRLPSPPGVFDVRDGAGALWGSSLEMGRSKSLLILWSDEGGLTGQADPCQPDMRGDYTSLNLHSSRGRSVCFFRNFCPGGRSGEEPAVVGLGSLKHLQAQARICSHSTSEPLNVVIPGEVQ